MGSTDLDGALSRAMEKMALKNEEAMRVLVESHQKQVDALTSKLDALASQSAVKEVPKVPPLSSANVLLFSKRAHLPKWMVTSLDHLLARVDGTGVHFCGGAAGGGG